MKKTLSVAAVVLMTAVLGACGDDDKSSDGGGGGDDYCSALEDTKAEFETLDITALDDTKFDTLQSEIDNLRDSAPDEVSDDWATLGDGFDEFKSLLEEAGISFDDLQGMQAGEVPEGVDMEKLQELGTKMQSFSEDSGLEEATSNIEDHAKSECDITLDDSETTSTP